MEITKDDQIWLKNNFFPSQFHLKENEDGYDIEGVFSFSAFFDQEKQGYLLNPEDKYKNKKSYIEDKYDVAVYIPKKNNFDDNFYRHIIETGNRLEHNAKRFNLKIEDLHLNSRAKTLCIVGLFQENYSVCSKEFFKGPFLQFFYDQSYCERSLYETGKTSWPRGEYSHGLKGIFESYLDAYQEVDEVRKFEITEIMLRKIIISNEYGVKKEIKKILDNKELPKIIIYSKYMHGIFNLRDAMKTFNLRLGSNIL